MSSGVEFEEDKYGLSRTSAGGPSNFKTGSNKTSEMQQWLISHHLAKSPRSADFILLCLVGVNIIITIIVVKYFI